MDASPWGLFPRDLGDRESPVVHGTVYHVPARCASDELAKLLHRESAGYVAVEADVQCSDGAGQRALIFTATPANLHWAGPPPGVLGAEHQALGVPRGFTRTRQGPEPALSTPGSAWSLDAVAGIIASSHGPSGPNMEYVARLVAALASRGHADPYVDALLAAVKRSSDDSLSAVGR